MNGSKILVFFSFFIFLTLIQTHTTVAQPFKMGIFDPAAVLNRMPEMRELEQRMQNLIEEKSVEFTQLQTNFQQNLEDYQQKMGVLSDEARQQEEEQLGLMEIQIQEFQTEAQRELEKQRNEWLAPLIQNMQEAVNEVARQKNIDYLLTTALLTAGDPGPLGRNILYMNEELRPAYDITEEVISYLEL